MTRRAVPNISSAQPAETRDVFVGFLGFEVATDLGWVVTLASPTSPSAHVTIIGNYDPAAPGISVEVADIDAVHAKAVEQGLVIPYRCVTRRGCAASCSGSPRISVVRAFGDAINGRDVDAAIELCHPEIEFFSLMAQLEASPYRGFVGTRWYFRDIDATWAEWQSRSSSC